MRSRDQGVAPAGPGHSPEGGAASSTASPAKPSVPNAWTPGPWCVAIDEYGDVVVDPVGDENRVCTVGTTAMGKPSSIASFGHFDTPAVRADAALIAAAPELYEALSELVETLRREAPGTGLNNHRFDALGIKANSALAKARA